MFPLCFYKSWTDTANIRPSPRSPCAAAIEGAQRLNEANQHENEGFLSYESGFMPSISPATRLPEGFRSWDQLAASLPELLRDQTLRATVDGLAVLPTDAKSLPDKYLQRASTLVSIVSHAYVHADMAGPAPLPTCLSQPWAEITTRLGHEKPALSYIDLIVYNWRKRSDAGAEFCVENLELLVPTVGNAEERVFYLTQAEILSRATRLLNAIVEAQNAVLCDDVAALTVVLKGMSDTLSDIGRKSLMQIAPNPTRKSHVDPVVWAKSVAPLAVPLSADVPGPGGTASPLFHLMDNFIGRTSYNTVLGEEAQRIRIGYPQNWRNVISAAAEVDIATFIVNKNDAALRQSWELMKERYCGPMGLLGLHRRKVFAYLPMAFKLGRSATIAGFNGNVAQQEWNRVHEELEKSRQERCAEGNLSGAIVATSNTPKSGRQTYCISTLVEHSSKDVGFWFAANGRVYDATKYLRIHPGGDKILINSSGRDVTADLLAVTHLQEPTIAEKLERFAIGELRVPVFNSDKLRQFYDFAVAMAYKLTDLHTTFGNDVAFLDCQLTSVDPSGVLTVQKRRLAVAATARLGQQFIPSIASHAEVLAALCGSSTMARFKALQRGYLPSVSLDQGHQMLGLCKSQAVLLLKTLESVSVSASKLTNSQTLSTKFILEQLASLLEAF
ncbi:Cytochrome b5 hemesteroid binding domain [Pyrenophora tritici-repentis]|nr:Cytochrome b5 hemesteroid binding domain [Pyrenophora tritici-repentis]